MTYNIVFKRDAIGVKSATCSCGWSFQCYQSQNEKGMLEAIDNAIALHEKTHRSIADTAIEFGFTKYYEDDNS